MNWTEIRKELPNEIQNRLDKKIETTRQLEEEMFQSLCLAFQQGKVSVFSSHVAFASALKRASKLFNITEED